jgi:serine/threonine-protein kinase
MTIPATTIGNFQLLRTLGEGGMGVVFEAEHVTMHRRAAIKVLRPELIKDEQAIRRFFNEARATNEIRHPGIVQIYDCGTRDDGSPWLIMELLEGETLSRRIARGPMAQSEVVTLGSQAASVLEAAHRAGIIHRDLKPDNLFIVNNQETPTGERIKVLDFGIAKLSSSGAAKSMHTQTGMLIGTPLYMSPEQCRGISQVDARSDIYSFGLILYQMVAGELPFVSEGMGELFDMQMNRPPPPLKRKVPSVIPALAAAIEKALRKDPAERFQNMGEVQRALVAAGAAATPSQVSATPATPQPPQSDGRISAPYPLPVSNTTTLSAGAMEIEPLEVPRSRLARPLLIAGVLLLAGGGLFAARTLTGDKAAADNEAEAKTEAKEARAETKAASAAAPSRAATPLPQPAPRAAVPTAAPPASRPAPAPAPSPSPVPSSRITIDLRTAPTEARVVDTSDGRLIGVTPLHQTFDRRDRPLAIRIEKTGYLPKSLTIPRLEDYRGPTVKLERAGEPHEREREVRPPREPATGEHIIKL